jgi:hypothetical protein
MLYPYGSELMSHLSNYSGGNKVVYWEADTVTVAAFLNADKLTTVSTNSTYLVYNKTDATADDGRVMVGSGTGLEIKRGSTNLTDANLSVTVGGSTTDASAKHYHATSTSVQSISVTSTTAETALTVSDTVSLAANSSGAFNGLKAYAYKGGAYDLTGSTTGLRAFLGQAEISADNTGTVTSAIGVDGYVNHLAGAVTTGRSFRSGMNIATGLTQTNYYGYEVRAKSGSGTVTNYYGFYCPDISASGGTISRAIHTAAGNTQYLGGATRLGDLATNYAEFGTTGNLSFTGSALFLPPTKTPASSSASGTAGEFCKDTSYIYVCTATNTWKRVAISTW